MKGMADLSEILVRSQPHIKALIVTGVIAVLIRFKYGREVHGIAAELGNVRDPIDDLEDTMCLHAVVLTWSIAEPDGIDLIEDALLDPRYRIVFRHISLLPSVVIS